MTLVELLVVLGVIGLIVSMSLPALATYSRQVRLKAITRQAIGLVTLARSSAISAHEPHELILDQERRELRVVNVTSGEVLEQAIRLPQGVTVEFQVAGSSSTDGHLSFRPTGALTGRTTTLVLSDGQKQRTITIMGATGALTVQ